MIFTMLIVVPYNEQYEVLSVESHQFVPLSPLFSAKVIDHYNNIICLGIQVLVHVLVDINQVLEHLLLITEPFTAFTFPALVVTKLALVFVILLLCQQRSDGTTAGTVFAWKRKAEIDSQLFQS